jgi:hypothetical protein
VSAQGKTWILLPDQFDQRACVEPVQGKAPLLKLPRTVKGLIEPTQEIWPTVHELYIEIRIDLSKDGIGVTEDFDMSCGNTPRCKGSDKGIRCPKMASGCRSG